MLNFIILILISGISFYFLVKFFVDKKTARNLVILYSLLGLVVLYKLIKAIDSFTSFIEVLTK